MSRPVEIGQQGCVYFRKSTERHLYIGVLLEEGSQALRGDFVWMHLDCRGIIRRLVSWWRLHAFLHLTCSLLPRSLITVLETKPHKINTKQSLSLQ